MHSVEDAVEDDKRSDEAGRHHTLRHEVSLIKE